MSNQGSSDQRDSMKIGRRNLLKAIGATGLAVTATTSLPGEWAKPVMELGVLPAHAQSSPFQPPPVSQCIPVPTPADILLTADMSGSMRDNVEAVKSALTTFVGARDLSKDRLGLLSFNTTTLVEQPLTQDVAVINNAINRLSAPNGATSIAYGIGAAQNLLEAGSPLAGNQKIILLFSDGAANETNEFPRDVPTPEGAAAAIAAANVAKSAGIRLMSVAVAPQNDPSINLMRQLASSSADFFYVADLAQLQQALSQGCQPQ